MTLKKERPYNYTMLKFSLFLVTNIALFLILDALWLRVFASQFFKKYMKNIALLEEGNFKPRIPAAAYVYFLMAFALEYFVFTSGLGDSLFSCVINSALIGLVTFGIYDFTNRAVLKDYPLILALVDSTWGVVIFTTTGILSFFIRSLV